jgi:hypothetical protein
METIMERTVIAIDIAKKVFQLHWVEMDTGCIERLQLKRAKLLEWFWDARLTKLNHQGEFPITRNELNSGGRRDRPVPLEAV